MKLNVEMCLNHELEDRYMELVTASLEISACQHLDANENINDFPFDRNLLKQKAIDWDPDECIEPSFYGEKWVSTLKKIKAKVNIIIKYEHIGKKMKKKY